MSIKEVDLKNFSRVEISNTFDFEIVQSKSFGIKLDADEGFLKNINVDQDNDKLIVTHSHHISWMFRFTRPKVRITMPTIKELRLTGAVGGRVSGFSSAEDFSLDMTGACTVTLDIKANHTEFHVRGACTINAKGAAESLVIDVGGACTLDMKDYVVNNAAIRLNGATTCTVNVNGRLDARLGGVSTLLLIGEPTMGDIRSTGMAKINKIS